VGATSTALAEELATQIARLTQEPRPDPATPIPEATSTVDAGVALPEWPVLFEDRFENNDAGWRTGSLAEENNTLFEAIDAKIENGIHQVYLASKQPNYLWWNSSDSLSTGDQFVLKLNTQQIAGAADGWRGVILHKQDENNYYVYAISDSGAFTFWALVDDKFQEIVPSTPTDAVQPGQWNEIAIVANGPIYSFYVNAHLVGQATDATLTEGTGGLYFETGSDNQATFETNSVTLSAP
jgi:hypothetical protein